MNAERMKSLLIASYTPARALLLWSAVILVAVLTSLIVWYAPGLFNAVTHSFKASAKQSEDVTGKLASASTRLDNIAAMVEARVDPILDNLESGTGDLKSATESVKTRVPEIISSFTGIGTEGAALIADIRQNNPATSARRLIDEARPNIVGASEQLKTGMTSLADAARVIDESIKDPKVKTFVDEAMARGKSILINLDTATSDVTFITADGRKVTTHAIGISANFEAMTADSKLKLHQVLFPEKAKGFWPRTGQILRYIWQPVSEGLRVYYELRELPVRITQPIPLLR